MNQEQSQHRERCIIVNADDFGLTSGINRGIIEAHERGIVTSASLMVRHPAAREAAEYARAHSKLSVGLHLELAEWRYRKGEWYAAYEVVDAHDENAVEAEVYRQLAEFAELIGRGPSHLDSHQHVHLAEPVRSMMQAAAQRLAAPLRSCTPDVKYTGDFYGQTGEGEPFPEGISLARLLAIIDEAQPGWTEIGCHPGYPAGVDSVYAREREEELRVLCRAEVRAAISAAGVELRSFGDYTAKKEGAGRSAGAFTSRRSGFSRSV